MNVCIYTYNASRDYLYMAVVKFVEDLFFISVLEVYLSCTLASSPDSPISSTSVYATLKSWEWGQETIEANLAPRKIL